MSDIRLNEVQKEAFAQILSLFLFKKKTTKNLVISE